jgi:choline dehydrogenase-like flavoprotein
MNEQFDYIVVAPGQQAVCWPTDLSADPSKRVLLLEAGGRTIRFDPHPSGLSLLHRQSADRLALPETQAEPGAQRTVDPVSPRRVFGGCSSIDR